MHKDKNPKLKMGPIWDFNLGFGNVNYCDAELNLDGHINLMTYVEVIIGKFLFGGIDV